MSYSGVGKGARTLQKKLVVSETAEPKPVSKPEEPIFWGKGAMVFSKIKRRKLSDWYLIALAYFFPVEMTASAKTGNQAA